MIKNKLQITREETAQDHDTFLLYKVRENMFSVQQASKEYPEFKEAVDKFRNKQMTRDEFIPFARKFIKFHGKLIDYSRFDEEGRLKV